MSQRIHVPNFTAFCWVSVSHSLIVCDESCMLAVRELGKHWPFFRPFGFYTWLPAFNNHVLSISKLPESYGTMYFVEWNLQGWNGPVGVGSGFRHFYIACVGCYVK